MATLYERNGQYYLNYSINGRRIRKAVGKNKKEAEVYLNDLRFKLSKGDIRPNRPEIPLEFFIGKYLNNCHTRLTESSCERYQEVLTHLLNYCTNQQPIQFVSQITRGLILGYISYRQQSKSKNKTINLELTIIRAALMWALDNEWIEKNPASRVKMLKTNDSKPGKIITEEEIKLLLIGCNNIKEGEWFRDILVTFLNTGMRLGELINLTWNDIIWDQRMIKIQDKPFWQPKTFKRDIPYNPIVESLLERLKIAHRGIFVFNLYVFKQSGQSVLKFKT